jgi:WD40 repeat protein
MKKRHFMMLVLFILILETSACQAAPTAAVLELPASDDTAVPVPTNTFIPTTMPTATTSPDILVEDAGAICEDAFSQSVKSGTLLAPTLGLMKFADHHVFGAEYQPHWESYNWILPHVRAFSASDLHSLMCIEEELIKTGSYTDGSGAYQIRWNVRLVAWPEGDVLASKSFQGGLPPKIKPSGSFGGGSDPQNELRTWVLGNVHDKDFLFIGDQVADVAVSTDGKYLAVAQAIHLGTIDPNENYQGRIILIDLSTRTVVKTLDGHPLSTLSLDFSPDGALLASMGYDRTLRFWNVSTGALLNSTNINEYGGELTFSPDGSTLVVANGSDLLLVDPHTYEVRATFPIRADKVLFSPSGRSLFVSDDSYTQLINQLTGEAVATFPDPESANPGPFITPRPSTARGPAISPDGNLLVTYDMDHLTQAYYIDVWNLKTRKVVATHTMEQLAVSDIEFSPTGLLVTTNSGGIQLWNAQTGNLLSTLVGHVGLNDIDFTPDGRTLVSGASDGTVRFWDISEIH